MTTARDYVTEGVGSLPQLGQQPNVVAYLSVYLAQLTTQETAIWQALDGFYGWQSGARTYSWILDTIGTLIGQVRPSGFGDDDYRFVLIARTISRVSDSSRSDVERLVAYLAQGGSYQVTRGVPEHWYVSFFDLVLTAQWQAVYADLLLATIGATDSLELALANGGTARYDTENVGYDLSTYAP